MSPEMPVQLPCQQVEPVLNEFLDLDSPSHDVSDFRISILRKFVSLIEVITQILVGIYARLDQLSSVLIHLSRLRE